MSTTTDQQKTDEVTDFAVVLTQHAKGSTLREASRALAEVVDGAIATNKKGHVTIKLSIEPVADGGAVKLRGTVTKSVPEDPTASVWFADGDGHISRDNTGLYTERGL
ncbi:hypothetical protein MYK68_14085 [Gordonia sp. PP30]|uniref:hypothetical protein n=1 Tax=Gordonia sp. PP30 TaxID=2935861 RepID=UPI001FFEACC5|nr:hypothetical protein [Gordonia sp. PP30]UQE73860.1 hypothetical protein MYK68_14085 [Gordonia sp. PP30]